MSEDDFGQCQLPEAMPRSPINSVKQTLLFFVLVLVQVLVLRMVLVNANYPRQCYVIQSTLSNKHCHPFNLQFSHNLFTIVNTLQMKFMTNTATHFIYNLATISCHIGQRYQYLKTV